MCTSVNEVICHGIPDARELQSGDIVNVDVTAFLGGYHGDLNETFTVCTGCGLERGTEVWGVCDGSVGEEGLRARGLPAEGELAALCGLSAHVNQ